MTALSTISFEQSAHIFTDAAVYDETGKVIRFHDKVWISKELNIAVSTQGMVYWKAQMRRFFVPEHFTGIDDINDGADDFFREWTDNIVPDLTRVLSTPETVPDTRLHCVVAGWSARADRPLVISYTSSDGDVTRNPNCTVSPYSEQAAKTFRICQTFDDFDPTTHGVLLFDALRNNASKDGLNQAKDGIVAVGGWGTVTTIDREGIRSETVCTWPDDRPGTYLDLARPQPGKSGIDFTERLNRKQRRKLARLR